MRTARDAEARNIDLSFSENTKVADLNDYHITTELPDTAREYGIEDRVVVVHAVIESVSKEPDGTVILKLRDGDFHVLSYIPAEACSVGSVFESQIGAVRMAVTHDALHVGDSVIVRSLVLFDHVTSGGAASGVTLTPVLGLSLPNGATYGLRAVPTP